MLPIFDELNHSPTSATESDSISCTPITLRSYPYCTSSPRCLSRPILCPAYADLFCASLVCRPPRSRRMWSPCLPPCTRRMSGVLYHHQRTPRASRHTFAHHRCINFKLDTAAQFLQWAQSPRRCRLLIVDRRFSATANYDAQSPKDYTQYLPLIHHHPLDCYTL